MESSVEPVYVIEPGSTIHIYLKENQHVDYIEIVPFKDSGNESEPMFLHLNSEALHKDECRILKMGLILNTMFQSLYYPLDTTRCVFFKRIQ